MVQRPAADHGVRIRHFKWLLVACLILGFYLNPTPIAESTAYASEQKQSEHKITFQWPTDAATITQKFYSWHPALDISNSSKIPVYAAAAGKVEAIGWDGGYGRRIIITHAEGYQTLYAHLSQIKVAVGDLVEAGQEIGRQGNTGQVRGKTGIHLHFEILKDGVRINPLTLINPADR